mgnify:CR=1 FL=1
MSLIMVLATPWIPGKLLKFGRKCFISVIKKPKSAEALDSKLYFLYFMLTQFTLLLLWQKLLDIVLFAERKVGFGSWKNIFFYRGEFLKNSCNFFIRRRELKLNAKTNLFLLKVIVIINQLCDFLKKIALINYMKKRRKVSTKEFNTVVAI